MACKLTPEDFAKLERCSEILTEALTRAFSRIEGHFHLKHVPPCLVHQAFGAALVSHTMLAFLKHRQSHGFMRDVDDLHGDPVAMVDVTGEMLQVVTSALNQADPEHEYSAGIVKREKT